MLKLLTVLMICSLGLVVACGSGCGAHTLAIGGQQVAEADVNKAIIEHEVLIRKASEIASYAVIKAIGDPRNARAVCVNSMTVAAAINEATAEGPLDLATAKGLLDEKVGAMTIPDYQKQIICTAMKHMLSALEGVLESKFATADQASRTQAVQALLRGMSGGAIKGFQSALVDLEAGSK